MLARCSLTFRHALKQSKKRNNSDTDSSTDEGELKSKKKPWKPQKKKKRHTEKAALPKNNTVDEAGYASADQRTALFHKADLTRAEAAQKSKKTDRTLDIAGVFADVEEFKENGVKKKRCPCQICA